jgi:hypothetical protein
MPGFKTLIGARDMAGDDDKAIASLPVNVPYFPASAKASRIRAQERMPL